MSDESVEPEPTGPGDSPLERFLAEYWADQDAGTPKGIREYLDAHPGDDEAIVREYAAIQSGDRRTDERRIASYDLIRILDQGGQGVVYLARDRRLGREVALKVLARVGFGGEDALRRFRREVEIISGLDHPGLCGVYEADVDEGSAYIAMPYIRGTSLADRIAEVRNRTDGEATTWADFTGFETTGGQPGDQPEEVPSGVPGRAELPTILALVENVARALHVAHEAGVVHRDVKPRNIMISTSGDPILLDFGLASTESHEDTLTQTGDLFGTAAYMSAEQLAANRIPLDRRTDVYSLGVTLYECLTSARPFDAATRVALYQGIMTKEPIAARKLNPAISTDMETVLHKSLDKDRDRRYQTAHEFAEDLRRLRELEPITARRSGRWLRIQRWAQRNPAVAVSLSLFALALIGGLTASLLLLAESRRAWSAERASHGETQALQREYELLADDRDLSSLNEEDQALWPPTGELVARMEAWLSRAGVLVDRHPTYVAALEGLKSAELASGFSPTEQHVWRREIFERLVAEVPQLGPRITRMRERARFAASVYERTIVGERGPWERTRDALKDGDAAGTSIALQPQLGLVPLGQDRSSGHFEFALLQSGDVPQRNAEGVLQITEASAIVLVLLPGGPFTMGSPESEEGRQKNETQATFNLLPFFIGKHEVTQAQWIRVMEKNPSAYAKNGREVLGAPPATGLHPVEYVSWDACTEFVRRLGCVLPSEVEWEYACRAGTTTPFPFGATREALRESGVNLSDEDGAAIFDGQTPPGAVDWRDGHLLHGPVTAFTPNRFGLVAMAGNVSEWCRDVYAPRRRSIKDRGDGVDPDARGTERVFRGGNWQFGWMCSRSAFRDPHPRDSVIGCRGLRVGRPVR